MTSCHTSADDWRAAAAFLGEASLAESFDEFVETQLRHLRALFAADLVICDRYDSQGRFLSYRASPALDDILPRLVEPFKVHFAEHPIATRWHDFTHRGFIPVLSDMIPVRRFLRTGLWGEVYIHQNAKYQIGLAGKIDEHLTWTAVCNRLVRDYGPRDRELCGFLRPRLERISQALARRRRADEAADAIARFFARDDAAFAFLEADGRIAEISPAARRLLAEGVPGGPAELRRLPEACSELRAALRRMAAGPSHFRVLPCGSRLQAIVFPPSPGQPALVLFPTSGGGDPLPARLTRREKEILGWLGEGKTNPAIATLLGLSVRTIEKHCTSIFAKLGVESRFAAALVLRGTR